MALFLFRLWSAYCSLRCLPAFLRKSLSGEFFYRGRRLDPRDPLLEAFAIGWGPAVQPDHSNGDKLFFHRDVLARLAACFVGYEGPSPIVNVNRRGDEVVLHIPSAGNKPTRTLVVIPRF